MSFYAYVHARPGTIDASGVFYVGKGSNNRAKDWYKRNKHHEHVLKKHGTENVMVGIYECSTEEFAFELEKGLIKCLRRMGVKLTNMTDGGEGSSGYQMTQEQRDRKSEIAREVNARPGVKASKSCKQQIENLKRWSNPEYRAKSMASMQGKKKTLSAEAIAQRKAAAMKSVDARKAAKQKLI